MTNVTREQWESLNNFLLPSHREVASPRWGWSVCFSFSFLTPVCRAVLRVFGMSLYDAAGIINRVCTCAPSPSSFQSLFTHSQNWTANKSDLLHQQTQCRFKTLSWPLGKNSELYNNADGAETTKMRVMDLRRRFPTFPPPDCRLGVSQSLPVCLEGLHWHHFPTEMCPNKRAERHNI